MVYLSVFVDVDVPWDKSNPGPSDGESGWNPPLNVTALTGLTQENFKIYEDGVQQKIEYLSAMSSGIVGIVAGFSARGPVKSQGPTILAVNYGVRLLQQPHAGSLVDWAPYDSIGIYDLITRDFAKLQRQDDPRKALIVVSDGAIPSGSKTADAAASQKLIEAARTLNFPVYFLFVGHPNPWRPPVCCPGGANAVGQTLQEVAKLTGGEVMAVAIPGNNFSNNLIGVAPELMDKLRRRYVIGFTSTNKTRDGKRRNLRVKVDPPPRTRKIHVDLATTGYFAID